MHRDAKLAAYWSFADGIEQVRVARRDAIVLVLGAHEQFDAGVATLLVEQLEEVSLPVHHGYELRVGHLASHFGAVTKTQDPVEGLLLFDGDVLGGSGILLRFRHRSNALSPKHTERDSFGGDRQGRVKVKLGTTCLHIPADPAIPITKLQR